LKILKIEETPFHKIAYRSSGIGVERELELPFFKALVDQLPEGIDGFVATSDLQGRELKGQNRLIGEVVAEELDLLIELKEIPKIGCVFLAGDFYDYKDLRKMGGTGDVTTVWNSFSALAPTVLGVSGNHDILEEKRLASNAFVLDGQVSSVAGLNVGGISGIIGREDRNQRKSESLFQKALRKTLTERTNILLIHQNPDDPVNKQSGSVMLHNYFAKKGKALVICGHSHWDIPLVEIGKNQVINVDKRVLIFIEKT
jgi:Icc-related predicted phosphoesterase